jgi:hypothetical protein
MSKRDEQKAEGTRKQSQEHAEGQHGDKTHARFVEQLHEGVSREPVEAQRAERHEQSAYEGRRRLVEDRQQHDDAERNSEKVRLREDLEAGTEPGPSDNRSSLRGVYGHREHRADFQTRDRDGFRAED